MYGHVGVCSENLTTVELPRLLVLEALERQVESLKRLRADRKECFIDSKCAKYIRHGFLLLRKRLLMEEEKIQDRAMARSNLDAWQSSHLRAMRDQIGKTNEMIQFIKLSYAPTMSMGMADFESIRPFYKVEP